MPSFAQEYGTSLLWSAVGHVALVLIALLAAVSIPKSPPPARLAIQATVIDASAIERRRQLERQRAREAEQRREAELERQRQQEEARRAAEREAAEQRKQAQEAARAAEAERVRQQEAQRKAEAERARQAEAQRKAEAEQARQAEAKRREAPAAKAREEKARQEAERKAAAERQRQAVARRAEQAEYERQLAEEEALLAAAESGEMAEYVALIRQRVERSWIRPPSARAGLECEVLVRQIPDGTVVDVSVGRCNGDDAVRRSIVAAVQKASPLPRPGNAALFERNLRFTFKPEE